MTIPIRHQRRRTKGFRLNPGVKIVDRSTRWGNPFDTAAEFEAVLLAIIHREPILTRISRDQLVRMNWIAAHLSELRRLPLACWCPLTKPCHADVLLRLANLPHSQEN